MSVNEKKVPKRRFKEFQNADNWEQRKLGKLVGVYDGVHQTPDYKESGIMFLSVENIDTLMSDKYISEEAFKRDYKVYPEKGDILMTRIGDVGTTNVVKTTEKVAFYVSLALLKPAGVDSYFLSNSMQSPLFQKGLKKRTLVTAIPQKINKDEIGNVDVILPKELAEQEKIGTYFKQLDDLITLHQRKLDKLKSLKKSYLTDMFPAEGESKPKLRFAGFTDDWKQRKLKQFCSYSASNLTANDTDINAQYDLYDANAIIGKTNKNIQKEDYITIIKDGSGVGRVRILPKNSSFIGTMGALKNEGSDINFLMCCLIKTDFTKEIAGATIPHIYFSNYGENTYFVPSFNEQIKVGIFFKKIDDIITLHQRKLEKLQNIKKAYLNEMFI